MLTIRFFARLREEAGVSEQRLALPDGVATVAQMRAWLRASDPQLATALADSLPVRTALNQQMCGPETGLRDGDELAFFPPVTGG
jgi:sulfur-carrier protein